MVYGGSSDGEDGSSVAAVVPGTMDARRRSRSSTASVSFLVGAGASTSGSDSDSVVSSVHSSSSSSASSASSRVSAEEDSAHGGTDRVFGNPERALATGNLVVLHSDRQDLVVTVPSATTPMCSLTDRRSTRLSSTVLQIIASLDSAPDRLFAGSSAQGANGSGSGGGGGGSGDGGGGSATAGPAHPRVDLALQKMSLWPRLVALQLEQRDLTTVHEPDLEKLLASAMRSEFHINSMAIAFEPGRFVKHPPPSTLHGDGPVPPPVPEPLYAHFAMRSKDDASHIVFDDLLPPSYVPVYRCVLGRGLW